MLRSFDGIMPAQSRAHYLWGRSVGPDDGLGPGLFLLIFQGGVHGWLAGGDQCAHVELISGKDVSGVAAGDCRESFTNLIGREFGDAFGRADELSSESG